MSRKTKILQLKAEAAALDLEETKEQLEEYKKQFSEDFSEELEFLRYLKSKEEPQPQTNNENKKRHVPEDISKIYKAIARITHPDICDNENYHDFFKKAANAYRDGSWADLITLATTIGLENIEISPTTMILIEEEINSISDESKRLKNQVSWVWSTKTDETEEDIKKIMYNSLNINKEEFEKWKSEK